MFLAAVTGQLILVFQVSRVLLGRLKEFAFRAAGCGLLADASGENDHQWNAEQRRDLPDCSHCFHTMFGFVPGADGQLVMD